LSSELGASTVTVDGVPCEVKKSSNTEIKCKTGSTAQASVKDVQQPGGFGIKRTKVDPTDSRKGVSWTTLVDKSHPETSSLYTSFETYRNEGTKFGNIFAGYFKAPETGKYRFYIACDDNCKLKLDS